MQGGLRYREHAPASALASRVACYWTMRGAVPTSALGGYRVLPDGCIDLLFDLASAEARVVGVMTRAKVAGTRGTTDLLGVRFRPGEAAALLGLTARETRDDEIELASLPWLDRDLAARVADAPTTRARLAVLDDALTARAVGAARPDPRLRAAVARILASDGAADVAAVARAVGLGERQLERAFDAHVGLGPKALGRVARLQALSAAMGAGARAPSPGAALAAALGFSDQAHMIREVRALAGVTPGDLARERALLATVDAVSDSFNPGGLRGATSGG